MTRLRRREPRQRTNIAEGCVRQLLTGCGYFGPPTDFGTGDGGTEGESAMRNAWNANRAELLADWITEHPRSRPYAWWRFDAPERRRRIDGKPHPFDDPRRKAIVERFTAEYGPECWASGAANELYFGTPRIIIGDGCAEYESEAAYLDRLGLLTDGERTVAGCQR